MIPLALVLISQEEESLDLFPGKGVLRIKLPGSQRLPHSAASYYPSPPDKYALRLAPGIVDTEW